MPRPRRNLKQKPASLCTQVQENILTYNKLTSLHGLKYTTNPSLSYQERVIWLFVFSLSLLTAIYFITKISKQYANNPTVVNYNAKFPPVTDFPFPAITICNLNQIEKSIYLKFKINGSLEEQEAINNFCYKNDEERNENRPYRLRNVSDKIKKTIADSMILVKECSWKNENIDCKLLFEPLWTKDGMCFVFNRLLDENNNYTKRLPKINWSPETGYPDNHPELAIPLRSQGEGIHLGLTFLLDARLHEFHCSSSYSQGFKISVNSPLSTGRILDSEFLIETGTETRVGIYPFMLDASTGVRKIEQSKRHCYFSGEKMLRYFNVYTEHLCNLECFSNLTESLCNCTIYDFPSKSEEPCDNSHDDCIKKCKGMLAENECNCLLGCYELMYKTDMTYSTILPEAVIQYFNINLTHEYISKNMAVINFYFLENLIRTLTRNQLFTFQEFVSNVGSLLGVFLGLSFLSLVEIFYYISFRLFCKVVKRHRRNNKNVFKTRPAWQL